MDWFQITWYSCYTAVLLGLAAFGLHRYTIIYLFLKNRKRAPKPLRQFEELPFVTVQLPLFNERYVVKRLLEAVGSLDYPKERFEVQILDDSTDETTDLSRIGADLLKERGISVELIQRTDRTGFKAGALELGMDSARGELIYILDADFVPPKDVLHKMVHFFTDPKIGMVQTRWGHLNRDYSLLTRIQSMFLDGHLILEQTARSRSGAFFSFNGTAGMWRREAIIEAGGWEHDTLTEDLDLSYRSQLKGWKFVFLKDVVTPAELPVDINGFKTQQHRWTKGSVQACKKLLLSVWRSNAPLMVKFEATAHLTSNFAYLLLVFLCILVFPGGPRPDWAVWLDVPIFAATSMSVFVFYAVAQRELRPKGWWREMIYFPMLLALGIGMSINNGKAVLEAVFNKVSPFVRTPKYGIDDEQVSWTRRAYGALRSWTPIAEWLLAGYFSFVCMFAILKGHWLSIPFLLIFQIGFLYVACGSLGFKSKRSTKNPS